MENIYYIIVIGEQMNNCSYNKYKQKIYLCKGEIIMKKTFRLVDLDCANCAAKIESGVKKLDGVIDANVNFLSQKMVLEAEEGHFNEIAERVIKLIKKIEPDVTVKKM